MKHLILSTIASGLLSSLVVAQDTTEDGANRAIVDAYMAAYSAAEFDAMEAYMAEDILFWDATATGLGEEGLRHEGREATMEALRNFDQQYNPIGLNFEWDTVFESNDRYIFMGRVRATYPTQQEGTLFQWSAAQTTVLEVRDGHIVSQLDFADYEGAEQGLVPAQ